MLETRRLLCITAHPDDESMGCGPTLARYAAEGVAVSLVCATRGERGWAGPPEKDPGLAELGRIRTAELHAAARVLGLQRVDFLNFIDGDLDQAPLPDALAQLVPLLRTIRPQVVITFGPEGGYGHPDHIAISQFTTAALLCAADAGSQYSDLPSHCTQKLYFMVDDPPLVDFYSGWAGEISMEIDGVKRAHTAWPAWAITTRVPAAEYTATALRAIACHASQISSLPPFDSVPLDQWQKILGNGCFYRAFSLVNSGRVVEDDLFAGIDL